MAKPTVDGAGQAKLEVLASAMAITQTLHGHVEKYAIAIRTGQPTSAFGAQIKRAATPLVGLLRSQFQLLADGASELILIATRGGGADQAKLRMLREKVGQLKIGIELATTATLNKHAIADPKKGEVAEPAETPASGE